MITKISSIRMKYGIRRMNTSRINLFRFYWVRGGVGKGKGGYSAKFSAGLWARPFVFKREYQGWILCVAGLRLHYRRSYGGIIT